MNSSTSSPIVSPPRPRFPRLRRFIFVFVALATLLALIYAVEDWRGRRAWEKRKIELKARGMDFDWPAYIPPTVPDDQNFFKAPRMTEWFVRKDLRSNQVTLNAEWPPAKHSNGVVVAEVTVIFTNSSLASTGNAFGLGDPGTPRQIEKLILDSVGPNASGAQGPTFISKSVEEIKPAQIYLHAREMADTNKIVASLPGRLPSSRDYVPRTTSHLTLVRAGTNSFHVVLDPEPLNAREYLAVSDKLNDAFELMRQAVKRPFARMEGDYSTPMNVPSPHFVQLRNVVQILSQRAQCHLLQGEPEKAMDDLTLINDLRRTLEARPSGKPMTLVAAMINVAVAGIYTRTVADGVRLGAWREPQFAAIQEQLREVNLPPLLAQSLRSAGAFYRHHLETFSAMDYARVLHGEYGGNFSVFWRAAKDPGFWYMALAPRGWLYQNMVCAADAHEIMQDQFHPETGTLEPRKLGELSSKMSALSPLSPYSYFALKLIPNYSLASRTMAYQQTMANEAQIVCALERYRAAQGHFPETLEALKPQYLEKIPMDIIGGEPLKYRRTEDGKFTLYSVGWNEKDDGGVTVSKVDGSVDMEKSDWAWAGLLQ